MVKKTLLSLAVATALVSITGCNVSTTDRHENKIINEGVDYAQSSSVYPLFNPQPADGSAPQLPLATDIIFSVNNMPDGTLGKDGTAQTVDNQAPVTTAVNKLAGFSTVAPLYINFSEELDPATVVAGKTVLLVKLATGSKPLETAANPNPVPVSTDVYEASSILLDDGKTPAVRILFKKPLESKSKYLVVFTDGIKGLNGESAGSAATYAILESSDPINNITAQQQSLRTTIQNWQKLANAVLGGKGKSVFSYTFTTDGSLDQLKQYAAPGLFVKNNISVAAAEDLTDTASSVPKGTKIVARMVFLGSPANTSQETDPMKVTADQVKFVQENEAFKTAYETNLYAAIASTALPTLAGPISLADAAIAPKARTVVTIPQANVDGALGADGASPKTFGTHPADTMTRYVQGTIELPDFLGLPEITGPLTGTPLDMVAIAKALRGDNNWSANEGVGALLDGALGQDAGTTPPKDEMIGEDGQKVTFTNVTYHFPFPAAVNVTNVTNAVPYLLTLPAAADYTAMSGQDCTNAAPFKTVIFVHGITSNRVASAAYGAQLASQCIATVAIDLPLHGVAPADGEKIAFSLASDVAAMAPWAGVAAVASIPAAERHGNIWQDDNLVRWNMDYSKVGTADYKKGGDSGSAFINLQNFGRTHDNLRQSVTDLLNLNASLANISPDLDVENVYVAGHSLGGIVASAFVAVNNDPEVQAFAGKTATNPTGALNPIKGLIIANSGGHITKLLENSPGFAPTILGGLKKAAGIEQGSENLEKFLYVFQSIIDGIDPANTTSALGDIPVQLFTVVGDAGTQTPPDTTVPVFDYFADATKNPFAQAVTPACYETPTAAGCDAEGVIALPSAGAPTAKAPLAGTQAIVVVNKDNSKFKQATYGVANHSTFADAGASMPTGNAQAAQANFVDMVQKSINLINGGGATADAK